MFQSLVELLKQRATSQPDEHAYIFLADGETDERRLTYGELDRKARIIAGSLQRRHPSGSRALLLYPPGLDYVAAFFGCLYAGVIAVPAYPPRPRRPMPRIRAIVADSQPTVALTDARILSSIDQRLAELPDMAALDWIDTTGIDIGLADRWQPASVAADDLAYLQYTSGSTATPKGVMVSHGNLDYTLADLDAGWHSDSQRTMVTWLPPFHDMGLVFGILLPLYAGYPCVMMAPVSFIQRPLRWLQAISTYRATHSAAPNFAFELCLEKIKPEERAALDLSHWRIALNGAEPVRKDTMARFTATYSNSGFRWRAFTPGYGLAEATLQVSGITAGSDPTDLLVDAAALEEHAVALASPEQPESRALVGYEPSPLQTRWRIADPETLTACPPARIGEIWVAGPGVAKGYWNRPQATREMFQAHLADSGEGPFLRTGDLGFVHEGRLYVTGRIKDLIIVRGRNHYPQDIELTAEQSHPALEPGGGAAFSLEHDGEERVALVYELRREQRKTDPQGVIDAIRQAVAIEHELQLCAVALTMPGQLPKTSSGKIQRQAARAKFLAGEYETLGQWLESESETARAGFISETDRAGLRPSPAQVATTSPGSREFLAIRAWLVTRIAAQVKLPPGQIDVREPLDRYGLDSLAAVAITGELGDWLGRSLSPTLFYEFPTVEALARHLVADSTSATLEEELASAVPVLPSGGSQEPIAIIGIGLRFPGAAGPQAFWRLLRDGVDAISETPPDRWDSHAYYDPNPAAPGKMNTRWGGFLEQVDQFDASFFGITAREAARMDPQQRLLMEVAWEALEDGGQVADKLAGQRVGVFVGISSFDYGLLQLGDAGLSDAYAGTGSALSIAANRLSYFFDWRGPSLAVDTACSSSLVAVHLACQNLRLGECDLALVAGVNLLLSPTMTVNFAKAGFMASDGRCKPFDARADGYVRSEGAGAVLLKPLSQALADGDPIYALVLGSATNQDGRSNGLTAPNPQSQIDVLRRAYRNAGVSPADVSYVETHGTGTPLGDPIEAQALGAVLGPGRAADQSAAIGSVKSNIGHLEAAAGIAGLIKVALSLKHGQVPPSLHFHEPNPLIPFDSLRLRVQQTLTDWPVEPSAALAGVSAFGFGGANAHVVVQGSPARSPRPAAASGQRAHVIPLSARSPAALRDLALAYRDQLSASTADHLSDLAYTAGARRSHHDHRLAVVADTPDRAVSRLDAFLAGRNANDLASGHRPRQQTARLAFVFCGQGSHWWAMGRQLLATEPVFRQTVERCDALLRPLAGWSLLSELTADEANSRLDHTTYAQPAIFAVQLALVDLWRSWGIVPDAVIGHSMGEVAAAVTAGILDLHDALRIIFHRGRLMERARGTGKLVVVELSPAEAELAVAGLDDRIGVAVVNSPNSVLLGGETETLDTLVGSLQRRGVHCQYLSLDFSSHNPQMDPYLAEMAASVGEVRLRAASLPLVSTVTGQCIGDMPLDAGYWARNVREPVQFAGAMALLLQEGYDTFLEIGPHPVLAPAIMQNMLHRGVRGTALTSLRLNRDDRAVMLRSLAALYANGRNPAWDVLAEPDARLVSLPAYPWQRERYWIEASRPPVPQPAPSPVEIHDRFAPPAQETTADLMVELQWQPRQLDSNGLGVQPRDETGRWLIFADHSGLGQAMADRLQREGARCVLVFSGADFAQTGADRFRVDPARPEHFRRLLTTMFQDDSAGWRGLLHCWSLDAASPETNDDALDDAQTAGCGSVLHLVQALISGHPGVSLPFWLVTRGVQPVDAPPSAESVAQSPLWGLGRVVALEHPELWGGLIDLDPQAPPAEVDDLLHMIRYPDGEDQIALRGRRSYVARLQRGTAPTGNRPASRIRSDATYLITGGLGELGLEVARWLVDRGATRLALLGRTPLTLGSPAAVAVQMLEQRGASVLTLAADVGDRAQMTAAFEELAAGLPPLRGIVHAAGVLENLTLAELSLDALHATLRPKVAGTWLLQQLAGRLELDFFVLFSSMTSVLGWRYTGHYAAANHFLDTCAHHLRGDGQPATSVNWGPWGEAGMVSRNGQEKSFGRMGIAPLPVVTGLAQLGKVLATDAAQVAVIDADWERFDALYQAIRPSRLLAQLDCTAATHGSASSERPVIDRLRAAPRAQWKEILVAFLRQKVAHVLRVGSERVPGNLSVVELGLDSIMAMEVTWACNEELAVPLILREVFEPASLTALAAVLADKLAELPAMRTSGNGSVAHDSVAVTGRSLPVNGVGRTPSAMTAAATPPPALTSLVPLRRQGSRTPLFLVPPGASTVLSFGSLVQCLDADQPVYGLEPLGMDGRHEPQWRVEAMAAHYIDEIMTVQPQGPYLLGGRCFGGLVVFEMAQQLRAQGQQVALLAILDTLQPPKPAWLRDQSPDREQVSSNPLRRATGRRVRNMYLLWKRLTVTDAFALYTLRQVLPEDRFPNMLGAEARHIRNTARAHYQANEMYLPRLYEGRLTLFSNAGHTGSHQLNWAALTAQAVDIHVVPGNHLTMFKAPYVRVLADVLTNTMEQALQRAGLPAVRRPFLRSAPNGGEDSSDVRTTAVRVKDTDHTGLVADDALAREIGRACAAVLGAQPAADDHIPDVAERPFVEAYLAAELTRRTGQQFSTAWLIAAPTVSQLASLASDSDDRSRAASRTLVSLNPAGGRSPIFLIPDIDQTVASLAELASLLGPQQPCYGLQPPGVRKSSFPGASLPAYRTAMMGERPITPTRIAGGSTGLTPFT